MLSSVSSRSPNLSQLINRMQSQLANVQAQLKPTAPTSLSGMGGAAAQPPVSAPAAQPQSDFARRYHADTFEPAPARHLYSNYRNASEPAAASASGAGAAPTTAPAGTTASNPDAVAQKIAQEATGWNYDHSGGKTWGQTTANESTFDSSKSGVCTDMALEAAQQFKDAGVNARVVFGNTDRGNHAWVEYQDANGQWKSFDPTAAASTGNADAAITPMDNGLYGYGQVFQQYTAPAEQ
jgi:hypothetical protein